MGIVLSLVPAPELKLSWTTVLAAFGAIAVASRVVKLLNGLKAVGSLPGLRVPFQPMSLFGGALPTCWWNPGLLFVWTWRKDRSIYRRYGSDTVSIVPFIAGSPSIYTQSIEVAKQVVVSGHTSGTFGKTDDMGQVLLFWGPNIAASEGELWRKYRRITSPAFNNETYAFVWDASRKLYEEVMASEQWASMDVVEMTGVLDLTYKYTFIVFASVGFGMPFTWSNPPSYRGEMNIRECFEVVSQTSLFAMVAPSWAWKLPFAWVRRTRHAYDMMRTFMRTQVDAIRQTIRSQVADGESKGTKDLFTLLVQASENERGNMSLDDNEVIGNMFSFMLAGHETTAQAMATTLALLALDLKLQDELVAQVQEVTQDNEDGALLLEDYAKLDKILAAFYEGVRRLPSGAVLIREAKKDTVINVSDDDVPKMLPVKKGTHVVVDMVGAQYNTRYFSDPEEFRPSRWYKKQKDWESEETLADSEEYTAFSLGPRACLGRKFSSTESVCFLALLLRDWQVEPLLARKPNGQLETIDEWKERTFQIKFELVLGIRNVPLRFVRRK